MIRHGRYDSQNEAMVAATLHLLLRYVAYDMEVYLWKETVLRVLYSTSSSSTLYLLCCSSFTILHVVTMRCQAFFAASAAELAFRSTASFLHLSKSWIAALRPFAIVAIRQILFLLVTDRKGSL